MAEFTPQPVKGPDDPQQFSPESIDVVQESGGSRVKNFFSQNKWYVAAIVLGLLIIGTLAVFAFWPQQEERTEEAKVAIEIDAPETAQSGGEVIYHIKVRNDDSAKLVDMSLELVYDEGVSYVTSAPKAENLSGSSFAVPDLEPGSTTPVIIVKTLANGNINDQKKLVARLRYQFENFNSPFTAESSATTRLVAADVVLDLSGPTQANSSEVLKYELFYRNSSKKDIDNARIKITYPESFQFGTSTPNTSLGNNVWNIGTLKANTNGKINFEGSFSGATSGRAFTFTAEFLVTNDSGEFFTQSSNSFSTEISSKPLSVEGKLSSSSAGGIVEPGKTVSVELKFRNNTQVVHTGVQVIAQIESNSIVPGSIKTESGFVQDQTITWNGSSLNLLENLNPNDSGSVKFSFTVANPATTGEDKNLSITIKPRIKSNQNPTLITGADIPLKISSPSQLIGSVFHADGALPPQVGVQSGFRVRIAMTNSTNDYRAGTLVGYIPIGVSFDSSSVISAEKNVVKYDSSTGKLTWDFGQLLAHSGNTIPERVLEFTVRTTPSSSQAGDSIELFKSIVFKAIDDFTEQEINLGLDEITTSQLPEGSSSGRVKN